MNSVNPSLQLIVNNTRASCPPGRLRPGPELLSAIEVFYGLNPDERRNIAALCHLRHYRGGQMVHCQGDAGQDICFVVSGRLQASTFSVNGRQVILHDIGSGGMFGELSAIDGEPRYAHVIAVDDSLVCYMSDQAFARVRQTHPAVMVATIKHLAATVRQMASRVYEASALSVSDQVRATLLRLALKNRHNNSAVISPPPTHTEIGNSIGKARESVTRELNKLQRMGLVERTADSLIVTDIERLQTLQQCA